MRRRLPRPQPVRDNPSRPAEALLECRPAPLLLQVAYRTTPLVTTFCPPPPDKAGAAAYVQSWLKEKQLSAPSTPPGGPSAASASMGGSTRGSRSSEPATATSAARWRRLCGPGGQPRLRSSSAPSPLRPAPPCLARTPSCLARGPVQLRGRSPHFRPPLAVSPCAAQLQPIGGGCGRNRPAGDPPPIS